MRKEIFFVLMKFPAHSEVFAANEIKRLMLDHEVNVTVISYRHLGKDDESLIKEFGLSNVRIITPSVRLSLQEMKIFLKTLWVLLKVAFSIKVFCRATLVRDLYIIFLSSLLRAKSSWIIPNVVHCFWGHHPAWFLLAFNMKYVIRSMFLGAYDLNQKLPISKYVGEFVAEVVFTHSMHGVNELSNFGIPKSKVRLNYRGLDIEKLESGNSDPPKSFELRDGFVSAGRLIPQKGFLEMVEFFSASTFSGHLEIYGDGPEKITIENFIEHNRIKNVHLKGLVSQTDLYGAFRSAKFFLFLSTKEGEILPNVVKEAMLAGCVVICKRIPAMDELINDRANGFLFDSVDEIEDILKLPDHRLKTVALSARKHIRSNYCAKITVGNYLDSWL